MVIIVAVVWLLFLGGCEQLETGKLPVAMEKVLAPVDVRMPTIQLPKLPKVIQLPALPTAVRPPVPPQGSVPAAPIKAEQPPAPPVYEPPTVVPSEPPVGDLCPGSAEWCSALQATPTPAPFVGGVGPDPAEPVKDLCKDPEAPANVQEWCDES